MKKIIIFTIILIVLLSISVESKFPFKKTGKSIVNKTIFKLDSGSIEIACNDWSKQIGYLDTLRVSIKTREFITWLTNKAYKKTHERFIFIPSTNNFEPETKSKT